MRQIRKQAMGILNKSGDFDNKYYISKWYLLYRCNVLYFVKTPVAGLQKPQNSSIWEKVEKINKVIRGENGEMANRGLGNE